MKIGIWEVVIILVIILIIFGAGKLPKVMGEIGKGIKNMKDGINSEDETSPAKPKRKSAKAKK